MLEKLFSSKIRYKIIDYFLKNKEEKVYPAFLKKVIKEDAGNVLRELRNLTKWGFLKQVRKYNKNLYFLNKDDKCVPSLTQLFKLEAKDKERDKEEGWLIMEEVMDNTNPTLTLTYMISTYIEKFLKSMGIKKTPEKYLTIFTRGGYKLCFPSKNYQACSQAVLQMILDNPIKALDLNKKLLKKANEFFDFTEKARKLNLSKLSNQKLVKLLEDFFYKQIMVHQMGWIGNVVDFVDSAFSNYLLKYVENQIKSTNSKLRKGEVFSTLTTPLEESLAQKEYLNYLGILKEIQKDKRVYNIFKQNDSRFISDKLPIKFKTLIRKHVEKFGWIGYGTEGPGWGRDYYIDLLVSLVKQETNPAKLVQKSKKEKERTLKKQKNLIKVLKIDAKHEKLFKVAQGLVFTKGYRKDAVFHGFWCLEFLHREFARRTNLALKQVRYIYPWEYKRAILQKEKWSEELNARWQYHLHYSEKGKDKLLSGRKAKNFIEKLHFEVQKIGRVRKLEGDCASPGKVRGVVTIINSPAENKKIEKADILVSTMTNPDLMPAIRKAKAIITNIGGLTCHAAIVSREFGIPCVIGTKIATQVLKDGSVVEVDATHGIINIIKK